MPLIETSIHIAAPPPAVWAVLTDFDSFAAWNPTIVKAAGTAAVGSTLQIEVALRKGRPPQKTSARLLVCAPDRELRWGGGLRPFLWVEHWIRLVPEGAGTRVEHCESFAGLIARPGLWLLGLNAVPYDAMNAALRRRVEGT